MLVVRKLEYIFVFSVGCHVAQGALRLEADWRAAFAAVVFSEGVLVTLLIIARAFETHSNHASSPWHTYKSGRLRHRGHSLRILPFEET